MKRVKTMASKGIDISKHNGTIDFTKVKADGVKFVMIRAGYGANNIDPQFKRNISECNRLNIPCGVYWFSYALTPAMAVKEAEYCLAAVKPYRLEYPIAFDFEYDSVTYAKKQGVTITKSVASAIVNAFCGRIEKAGYYVVNYTNKDFMTNYFSANDYGLWLAAWTDSKEPPQKCQIWQYSSKGKVAGISGNVDMNLSFVDFPNVIKEAGLNNLGNWYDKALEWGVKNGITDGTNPEEPATRAQVITMLKRYHEKFGG